MFLIEHNFIHDEQTCYFFVTLGIQLFLWVSKAPHHTGQMLMILLLTFWKEGAQQRSGSGKCTAFWEYFAQMNFSRVLKMTHAAQNCSKSHLDEWRRCNDPRHAVIASYWLLNTALQCPVFVHTVHFCPPWAHSLDLNVYTSYFLLLWYNRTVWQLQTSVQPAWEPSFNGFRWCRYVAQPVIHAALLTILRLLPYKSSCSLPETSISNG